MSAESITHAAALRIDRSHPALPGHFPGNPVVPGVVLLDHVQQAAQQWLGRPVTPAALPQVKFMAPLLPEQHAEIHLRLLGSELRFSIHRGEEVIAQGIMTLVGHAS